MAYVITDFFCISTTSAVRNCAEMFEILLCKLILYQDLGKNSQDLGTQLYWYLSCLDGTTSYRPYMYIQYTAGRQTRPSSQRAQIESTSHVASCFSRALPLIISCVYFSQNNPTDKIWCQSKTSDSENAYGTRICMKTVFWYFFMPRALLVGRPISLFTAWRTVQVENGRPSARACRYTVTVIKHISTCMI